MQTNQMYPAIDTKTLKAAVETIFPTAVTAGAQDFILKNLEYADKEELSSFREGLQMINTIAWLEYDTLFAALTINERIKVLEEMEGTEFFDLLRRLTMEGMFADPIYGGNKNKIGWKLIGFPGTQFHPITHLSRGWVASVFVSLKDKERLRDHER